MDLSQEISNFLNKVDQIEIFFSKKPNIDEKYEEIVAMISSSIENASTVFSLLFQMLFYKKQEDYYLDHFFSPPKRIFEQSIPDEDLLAYGHFCTDQMIRLLRMCNLYIVPAQLKPLFVTFFSVYLSVFPVSDATYIPKLRQASAMMQKIVTYLLIKLKHYRKDILLMILSNFPQSKNATVTNNKLLFMTAFVGFLCFALSDLCNSEYFEPPQSKPTPAIESMLSSTNATTPNDQNEDFSPPETPNYSTSQGKAQSLKNQNQNLGIEEDVADDQVGPEGRIEEDVVGVSPAEDPVAIEGETDEGENDEKNDDIFAQNLTTTSVTTTSSVVDSTPMSTTSNERKNPKGGITTNEVAEKRIDHPQPIFQYYSQKKKIFLEILDLSPKWVELANFSSSLMTNFLLILRSYFEKQQKSISEKIVDYLNTILGKCSISDPKIQCLKWIAALIPKRKEDDIKKYFFVDDYQLLHKIINLGADRDTRVRCQVIRCIGCLFSTFGSESLDETGLRLVDVILYGLCDTNKEVRKSALKATGKLSNLFLDKNILRQLKNHDKERPSPKIQKTPFFKLSHFEMLFKQFVGQSSQPINDCIERLFFICSAEWKESISQHEDFLIREKEREKAKEAISNDQFKISENTPINSTEIPIVNEEIDDNEDKHACTTESGTMKPIFSIVDMEKRVVLEAAMFCVSNKLKTMVGGATQTFEFFENILLHIAGIKILPNLPKYPEIKKQDASVGTNEEDKANAKKNLGLVFGGSHLEYDKDQFFRRAQLFCSFVHILEREIRMTADGFRSDYYDTKTIHFFYANKKVCQDWFARLRPYLVLAGNKCRAPSSVVRNTMQRLREIPMKKMSDIVSNFAELEKNLFIMAGTLCKLADVDTLEGLCLWFQALSNSFSGDQNKNNSKTQEKNTLLELPTIELNSDTVEDQKKKALYIERFAVVQIVLRGLCFESCGMFEKALECYRDKLFFKTNESDTHEKVFFLTPYTIPKLIDRVLTCLNYLRDWDGFQDFLGLLSQFRTRLENLSQNQNQNLSTTNHLPQTNNSNGGTPGSPNDTNSTSSTSAEDISSFVKKQESPNFFRPSAELCYMNALSCFAQNKLDEVESQLNRLKRPNSSLNFSKALLLGALSLYKSHKIDSSTFLFLLGESRDVIGNIMLKIMDKSPHELAAYLAHLSAIHVATTLIKTHRDKKPRKLAIPFLNDARKCAVGVNESQFSSEIRRIFFSLDDVVQDLVKDPQNTTIPKYLVELLLLREIKIARKMKNFNFANRELEALSVRTELPSLLQYEKAMCLFEKSSEESNERLAIEQLCALLVSHFREFGVIQSDFLENKNANSGKLKKNIDLDVELNNKTISKICLKIVDWTEHAPLKKEERKQFVKNQFFDQTKKSTTSGSSVFMESGSLEQFLHIIDDRFDSSDICCFLIEKAIQCWPNSRKPLIEYGKWWNAQNSITKFTEKEKGELKTIFFSFYKTEPAEQETESEKETKLNFYTHKMLSVFQNLCNIMLALQEESEETNLEKEKETETEEKQKEEKEKEEMEEKTVQQRIDQKIEEALKEQLKTAFSDCSGFSDLLKGEYNQKLQDLFKEVFTSTFNYYKEKTIDCFFRALSLTDEFFIEKNTGRFRHHNIFLTLHLVKFMTTKFSPEFEPKISHYTEKTHVVVWIEIIPQLLAHLTGKQRFSQTKELIKLVLLKIAKEAPEFLVYPLVVGVRNSRNAQNRHFQDIFAVMKSHFPKLVQGVESLIGELSRITMLWDEIWLDNLNANQRKVQKQFSLFKDFHKEIMAMSNISAEEKVHLLRVKYTYLMAPILASLEATLKLTSVPAETKHEREFQQNHLGALGAMVGTMKKYTTTPQERLQIQQISNSQKNRPLDAFKDIEQDMETVMDSIKNFISTFFQIYRTGSLKLEEIANGKRFLMCTENNVPIPGIEREIDLHYLFQNSTKTRQEKAERKKLEIPSIVNFESCVRILNSKTKPKKISLFDSNGKKYSFLLKGREDLRLDERIMQFLEVCNLSLKAFMKTKVLLARTYTVIPLGAQSGLIRWVTGGVPIFSLHRKWWQRKILHDEQMQLLNKQEQMQLKNPNDQNKQIQSNVPNSSQKGNLNQNQMQIQMQAQSQIKPFRPMEIFANKLNIALKNYKQKLERETNTPNDENSNNNNNNHSGDGKQLHKPKYQPRYPIEVLRTVFLQLVSEFPRNLIAQEIWYRSSDTTEWRENKRLFNRSVGVMSIIGYIIGLGDRHLENILVDFKTGEVVHIDYNVCFDKGKKLKVPEIVPFRMTPVIQYALGVFGVDGLFRVSCEQTLEVMKKTKETLLMLLEAFLYDPLIDWEVTGGTKNDEAIATTTNANINIANGNLNNNGNGNGNGAGNEKNGQIFESHHNHLSQEERPLECPEARKVLLKIKKRLSSEKLIQDQVEELIQRATSVDNLCQMYEGWCPFL